MRSHSALIGAWPSVASVLLLLLGTSAHAKVMAIALRDLSQQSPVIVVAEIGEVVTAGSHKYAELKVLSPVRGVPSGSTSLMVRASPSWECDISAAQPGERALYLLQPDEFSGTWERFWLFGAAALYPRERDVYQMAHSGRGRIPLRRYGEELVALVYREGVELPTEVKVLGHTGRFDSEAVVAADELLRALSLDPIAIDRRTFRPIDRSVVKSAGWW